MAKATRMTITALAAKTGVSVCTVNNALTGKGRMSATTRQKVLEAAARAGYRPNRMAQALARNPVRLVVVVPDDWPGFYGPLAEGARQAALDLADRKVSATVCCLPAKADARELRRALTRVLRPAGAERLGVILCPGFHQAEQLTEILTAAQAPVALMGLDLPGLTRVALVRHDAQRSGRLAAELLGPMAGGRPLAILVGNRAVGDHHDKLAGFQAETERLGLVVCGVYEAQDDPAQAYPLTARILREHPNVGGIYVSTDNSAGVCRFFEEHRLAGRVRLAVTGVFPEVQRALENGVAQFALYQRMRLQGRLAAQTLYRALAENRAAPGEILLPPLIATRNNMDVIEQEPKEYLA